MTPTFTEILVNAKSPFTILSPSRSLPISNLENQNFISFFENFLNCVLLTVEEAPAASISSLLRSLFLFLSLFQFFPSLFILLSFSLSFILAISPSLSFSLYISFFSLYLPLSFSISVSFSKLHSYSFSKFLTISLSL